MTSSLILNTQTGAVGSNILLLFNVVADQAASETQAAFFSLSNGFKHLRVLNHHVQGYAVSGPFVKAVLFH